MLAFIVALAVGTLLYKIWQWWRDDFRKIPGPPSLPFIGNYHLLDKRRPLRQLADWKTKYGDVIRVQLFGKNTIILNSVETIRDALINKARDFAGRDEGYRSDVLSYGSKGLLFGGKYSDTSKSMRKLVLGMAKTSNIENMKRSENLASVGVNSTLEQLSLSQSKLINPTPVFFSMATNLVSEMAVGSSVKFDRKDTDALHAAFDVMSKAAAPLGEGMIYDVLPCLARYFTDSFKDLVKGGVAVRDAFVEKVVNMAQAACDPKEVRSTLDILLNKNQASGVSDDWDNKAREANTLDDVDLKAMMSDFMMAGAYSSSTINSLMVLACVKHPEIVRKLQAEIDEVIPRDQLPTLDDRSRMPYMNAFCLEATRYFAILPLGVPRVTQNDTSVGSYKVPKGTQVLINIHGISHDERYWNEPEKFMPERFLEKDGSLVAASHPNRRNLLSFGLGTRSCPGENTSKTWMFLTMSALLQMFKVVTDKHAQLPSMDPANFRNRAYGSADRFMCRFIPRE